MVSGNPEGVAHVSHFADEPQYVWQIFVASDTQGASLLNPLEESRSPSEPAKVKKEKTVFMPSWWKSPPSLYVPSHVKEEAIKNARKLVIQLENSKISGQDYSLDMIMQLYKACEVCVSLFLTIASRTY